MGYIFSISTPSPLGHSPYIPLRKHRGRGGLTLLLPLLVFLIPLLVATLLSSPLYFFAPHTAMLRGTAREDCDTKDFLSLSKKVLVTLIRFICSFFLAARKTNQEAPPFLLTPPSLRTPPLYFAVQNTEEEIESNPPLIAVRYSAYGARQGRSLEVALYSFAIFLFQPPRPAGTPPIFPYRNTPQCCGTRQGERRVNSITSIAGIFNPSPRRYTPQLSPIFFAPHTAMLRGTAGGEG